MGVRKSESTKKKLKELKGKELDYVANDDTKLDIKVNPRKSFDNKITLTINELKK